MKDVFISYRRELGEVYAEKLSKYLREKSRGLRVWFDRECMKDGKMFPEQLETAVRNTPNYVLIATQNVFTHSKEERDWVWEEIRIALDEYRKNPLERTLTVLVPHGVEIPAREKLPYEIRDIADVQRIGERTYEIELPFGHDWKEEFHRVFVAVTELNRRNIWYAAHRWLENARGERGRFSSLRIDETIMPCAAENRPRTELPIRVSMEENKSETKPLLDALSSTEGHLYLIGQGGIGKTTALMHIMHQAYDGKVYAENAQIPIFVELSYAPDSASGQIYSNGKSTFIRRAIFRQVRSERSFQFVGDENVETLTDMFGLPYDLAVRPVVDILSRRSPAPEYLLLLDGLNEVSTQTIEATCDDGGKTKRPVYEMIRDEIIWLIENCPNVRVVLTSRSDESKICENITKLYLSGIDETAVMEYLRNTEIDGKKIEETEIDRISSDTELMNVLRIPLFLTLYATLRDKNDATAAGEILHVFFNERRRGLPDQTIKDHLAKIEKNVNDDSAGGLVGRITTDMYDFILDFILPEIAWHLERKGEFLFSASEIRDIIMPVLQERDDLAVCGDFGQEAFTEFCSSNPEDTVSSTVEKILALANDKSKVNRIILGICVNVLGILRYSEKKYGFVHQHIRDYFAAVKNVNTMRLSVYMFEEGEEELALECMNRVFKEEPVSASARRFMGEYLGEHKNKPYFADGKWCYGVPGGKDTGSLTDRALSIFRGKDADSSFALYSIVEILKECRDDLRGCDFSLLDLRNCCLNGHKLGENGLRASFDGAVLSGTTFFPGGHTDVITSLKFSRDGKKMFTSSRDKTAIIWNTRTWNAERRLTGHKKAVNYIACSRDDSLIVTASDDGTAILWNADTYECINTLQASGSGNTVVSAEFSHDGKYIVTAAPFDSITLWDGRTGDFIKILDHDPGNISCAFFSKYEDKILTKYFDQISFSKIKYWDLSNDCAVFPFEGDPKIAKSASFSPDGEKLEASFVNGTVSVFDPDRSRCVKTYEIYDRAVIYSEFSLDGDRIFSNSYGETVRIIDSLSGASLMQYAKGHRKLSFISASADNRLTAFVFEDTIDIVSTETSRLIRRIKGINKPVHKVCLSIDDTYLAVTNGTEFVSVWEADNDYKYKLTVKSPDSLIASAVIDVSEDETGKTRQYGLKLLKNNGKAFDCDLDSQKMYEFSGFPTYSFRYGNYKNYRNYTLQGFEYEILITRSRDTVCVWDRGWIIKQLTIVPGLMTDGIDLRHIDQRSTLSSRETVLLKQYGAII